jgi:hypothetical protein
MYSSKEVRMLLGRGKLEKAVAVLSHLTQNSALQDQAFKISSAYDAYKQQLLTSHMSQRENTRKYEQISRDIRDLLEAYEILNLKNLHGEFGQLKTLLLTLDEVPDTVKSKADELFWLMDFVETVNQKEEVEAGVIARIGAFLNQIHTPDSSVYMSLVPAEGGIQQLKKVIMLYNRVAHWLALPRLPKTILRKSA